LKLLKHILFGNFWSFLLVLSGVVDIAVGIFVLTGAMRVKGSSFPVFIVCFVTGFIYLSAGLAIAVFKMRKEKA
jgi:hypothetical protein